MKPPPTCISQITQQIQENTERTCPLATTPWHDEDLDTTECVCTFLPPNLQGESAKEQWTNDDIKFITENEENPDFLAIYADGSLVKKDGKRLTGYGAISYYLGKTIFKIKGALGEQAEVFNAEMTGLSTAGEATKQFILNRDWVQQPSHIVFYADNSAAISCIYKGTPGKAQEQSLAFRAHIKDILKEVEGALIAISWVPRHSSIHGNKKADCLAKEGAKLRPDR